MTCIHSIVLNSAKSLVPPLETVFTSDGTDGSVMFITRSCSMDGSVRNDRILTSA